MIYCLSNGSLGLHNGTGYITNLVGRVSAGDPPSEMENLLEPNVGLYCD